MRNEDGFSLLEVMAAVALLGFVFTALGWKATQGVMAEGDSRRRMEASLLADAQLAALELRMANFETPAVGSTREESDPFIVEIDVQPWTPPLPDRLPETLGPDLLRGTRGAGGLMRQIRVRVSWDDGTGERSIERVTFAIDYAALQPFAPAAEGAGQ